MINLKELKDIVTKLEILEEIKDPLQSLLDDINTLLQQGHAWINNIGNKTYQEMKELLDSEMAKFLRQCFCIASNGNEKFSETALTMEQLNQASTCVSEDVASIRRMDGKDHEYILRQIEELTANFTSHTEMLQTLQHKIKKQEKSFKSVSKLNEEKCEEIMKELQEASNFMSTLSEELNQTKDQIQDKKIQEISQNVVNYLEQRDSFAKEKEKVEILHKEVKRLTDELEKSIDEIKTKDCEIFQFKEDQAQAIKHLETKEAEIVKLRDEFVAANDTLKKKDKEIVRFIKFEDFKRCIDINLKHTRNLKDEGVGAFWLKSTDVRIWDVTYCLSRKDLISNITLTLNEIGLSTSECAAFWKEYKKYLNS